MDRLLELIDNVRYFGGTQNALDLYRYVDEIRGLRNLGRALAAVGLLVQADRGVGTVQDYALRFEASKLLWPK